MSHWIAPFLWNDSLNARRLSGSVGKVSCFSLVLLPIVLVNFNTIFDA
jgi:hypothetical protein